jgi:mRNA interferase MazF
MKRGEVWRVRMPAVPGHTQGGERPAIILQDQPFNANLPTVLIVPFTSTIAATRFPGTLLVQPTPQSGLSFPSVALVFQLSALDKRNCLKRLGELDGNDLNQVLALLDRVMGR